MFIVVGSERFRFSARSIAGVRTQRLRACRMSPNKVSGAGCLLGAQQVNTRPE